MKETLQALIRAKSVRITIVLVFTGGILFFAVLTGLLAYNSSMQTVTQNANQVAGLVNAEIAKTLTHYLAQPLQLEQFHKNVILNQQIDFENEVQRDRHFVEALKIFPNVTNTYVGLSNGSEYGARREDDGRFVVWEAKAETGTLNYYRFDNQAGRQEYIRSLFLYDTRERPPYLKGKELQRPGWTDVYQSATGRGLVVTAVTPVLNRQNELIGVLGSSLLLNWVDEFLKTLSITAHSAIYIVDRSGQKIAAAADNIPYVLKTEKAGKENSERDVQRLLLSTGLQALRDSDQSIERIDAEVRTQFNFQGENFIMHARPIQGCRRLDWINVMIIPESDLTQGMKDFTYQLVLLTVLACLFGIGAGTLLAQRIVNPIIKVNQRAKAIAEGDFSSKIDCRRHDEIGQLIHTVNEMSTKLEQSFSRLNRNRLRIRLLTAGLEGSSNQIVIIEANRLVWWANEAFEKQSGYRLDEIVGQDVLQLASEQNDPDFILHARTCLLQQREWQGELIARRKGGSDYVEEVSITPILDDQGLTQYYLIVGQDITEKVKAREAVQEAQRVKAKAEKFYSIGTMASGISHEINQPLNSIKVISGGILYMLRQGESLSPAEYEESLNEICGQADRIAGIVNTYTGSLELAQSDESGVVFKVSLPACAGEKEDICDADSIGR